MNIIKQWSIVVLSMSVAAWANAHHSRANFDMETTVAFQAAVTKFRYSNPHSYVFAEAPDENGKMVEWVVELGSIPNLAHMDMDADSLKTGDKIFIRGNPDRDRSKHYLFLDTITRQDGKRFAMADVFSYGRKARASGEGKPGSKDFSGVWSIQRSAKDILNATHKTPQLSLTAAGKAVMDAYNPDENPFFFCKPEGIPRNVGSVYPTIIERKADQLIIKYEFSPLTRTVYLNNSQPAVKPEPSVVGFSVGHMEGETLVIETDNFVPEKWGIVAGLDSGPGKRVTERYALLNDGHDLKVDVTVTDPQFLVAPYKVDYVWKYAPGFEITDYIACDPEAASLHLKYE